MDWLTKAVTATQKVEKGNSIYDNIADLKSAHGALDTSILISKIAAEGITDALIVKWLNTGFSSLRLGLAITGQAAKYHELVELTGILSGISVGKIVEYINDEYHPGVSLYDALNSSTSLNSNIYPAQISKVGAQTNATIVSGQKKITISYDGNKQPVSATWSDGNGTSGITKFQVVNGDVVITQVDAVCRSSATESLTLTTKLLTDGSVLSSKIQNVDAAGHVNVLVAGSDAQFTVHNAQVDVQAGSHAIVWGNTDSFTAADNAWLYAAGDNNTIHANGANDVITADGKNAVVTADQDTVWLRNGSSGAVLGDGNHVVADGTGVQLWATGNNVQVTSTQAGNTLSLQGKNFAVDAVRNAVWLNGDDTKAHISGDANTVVATGSHVLAETVGNDLNIVSTGEKNVLGVTGERATVTADQDSIWFNSGTDGSIHGNGNGVVAYGGDVQLLAFGNDVHVISTAAGNTISVQGNNALVNADHDAVWLNGNDTTGTVVGNANTVVGNGENVAATVDGDRTTAISASGHTIFTLDGTDQHVIADGDDVWVRADGRAFIEGDRNTIVADGAGVRITSNGDAETFVSHASGNQFLVDGDRNWFVGADNVILFTDGSDAQIQGNNRVYGLNQNDFQIDAPAGHVNARTADIFDMSIPGANATLGVSPTIALTGEGTILALVNSLPVTPVPSLPVLNNLVPSTNSVLGSYFMPIASAGSYWTNGIDSIPDRSTPLIGQPPYGSPGDEFPIQTGGTMIA